MLNVIIFKRARIDGKDWIQYSWTLNLLKFEHVTDV